MVFGSLYNVILKIQKRRLMRFLIVTFDFPPALGGVETRVKNYIQNMVRLNHQVLVVALTSRGGRVYVERYLGVSVYRCPSSPRFIFKVLLTIMREISDYHADVMFILTGACSLIGLIFSLYGKLKGMKTGIFLYGLDILSAKANPIKSLTLRFSLLVNQKVGVNSKATSTLIPKNPWTKIFLLYPGVESQDFVTELEIKRYDKTKFVLFVGRLIKRKGTDDLIYAFKNLLKNVPEAKLVIVGEGSEKDRLYALVREFGIQERVEFTGPLVGRRLQKKYQECDVFAMPSKKVGNDIEGFGIVFLEAALFKKPSVGTWSGGIPEAVIDRQTGLLVPEGDINALKEAIQLLLTDPKLYEELGSNAYMRVIKEFTWNKATNRLIDMYQ